MSKILEAKKARALQLTKELEAVKTLLDIAPADRQKAHYERAEALLRELEEVNADIKLCEEETRSDGAGPDGVAFRTKVVNGQIQGTKTDNDSIVLANSRGQQSDGQKRVKYDENKVIFRSAEKLSDKYDLIGIDAEKCLRAAITGNYNDLSEAEKRSVTPTTGGALLSPAVSSIIIDNLRQSDWMQIFAPTIVDMTTGETKIPNITALPTAVMHTPGTPETSTDPTITAATLTAKTIMTVVEVANELLSDAATSQGIILQAATDAISNKLLQQGLYGTGVAPEMKGITLYDAAGFAAAGSQAAEKDLFKLATLAKMAVVKKNGSINAMLYDCDLEDRLNKRLATGELVEPSRAFAELYAAGKVLAHPSVAAGDMLFMQSDALFLGIRQGLEIQIDPYSAFNSNNTKFRVIMRADVFANTARMVYYSAITEVEPA